MKKAITIPKSRPTVEEAQAMVGGYVEVVDLADGGQLLVDEEGLLKNLNTNVVASFLAGRHIVGPAVLLRGKAKWN
jgi:hypothetical protein